MRQHGLEIDRRAFVERVQEIDVDHRVVRTEARVREPALGHTAGDRHLSAFVAGTSTRTGALAPAFVPATGGLAEAAARTARDALAVGVADAFVADRLEVHLYLGF